MTLTPDFEQIKDGVTGDMYYRSASGLLLRVGGVRGAGQVIIDQAGGVPIWATPSGGGGGGSVALPGTIPDLVFWFESDNILGATGYPVWVLNNRTPWLTGSPAAAVTAAAATIASTTLNSLPVVTFPGSSAGRYASSAPFTGIFNNGATIFAVLNPNSIAAIGTIMAGASGSLQLRLTTAGKLEFVKTGVALIGTDTTALSVGTSYQINATYLPSSGAFAFRVARAASSSGTNIQTVNAANNGVGYNGFNNSEDLNAKVAAIIMYARVLSGAEITSVESYINTKWGV